MFDTALEELRSGRKRNHWMWFIFPQVAGLGHSATSRHFAIRTLDEARAYLDHPLLGHRLRQSTEALAGWSGKRDPQSIMGSIDSLKLRSSLTLFATAAPGEPVFEETLRAFFGAPDPETLRLLEA